MQISIPSRDRLGIDFSKTVERKMEVFEMQTVSDFKKISNMPNVYK